MVKSMRLILDTNEYIFGLDPASEHRATIAAFAEWQQVDILLSENRHFLQLQVDSFIVFKAEQFLSKFNTAEIWHIVQQQRDLRSG